MGGGSAGFVWRPSEVSCVGRRGELAAVCLGDGRAEAKVRVSSEEGQGPQWLLSLPLTWGLLRWQEGHLSVLEDPLWPRAALGDVWTCGQSTGPILASVCSLRHGEVTAVTGDGAPGSTHGGFCHRSRLFSALVAMRV